MTKITMHIIKDIIFSTLKSAGLLAAYLGLVYITFFSASFGWYQGEMVASFQENLKLLTAYIEQSK